MKPFYETYGASHLTSCTTNPVKYTLPPYFTWFTRARAGETCYTGIPDVCATQHGMEATALFSDEDLLDALLHVDPQIPELFPQVRGRRQAPANG